MADFIFYFYSMQEDYLHYLWEFQKWKNLKLLTSEGLAVKVISPGRHNHLSGPDFFNSRLLIGEQEWAGNVEIHINASDWYLHGHETDPAYDNVILHVVWNHDADIFRGDNAEVPVLELQRFVPEQALRSYRELLSKDKARWINCEKDFPNFDDFALDNWLERLYLERLEQKAGFVFRLLEGSSNDWEKVLFVLLARNFGLNVNGDAFFSIANSIPFQVAGKLRKHQKQLEALLLGQAGLLEKQVQEPYYIELKQEFDYLTKKFGLSREGITPVKYFRLRPDNFPEIRLSQFAAVYHEQSSLFSKVISAQNIEVLKKLFSAGVSEFWETHYTFQKPHRKRKKLLSPAFVELLIINTLIPLKFCYMKAMGEEREEQLLTLVTNLQKEDNKIIKKYNSIRPGTAENAMQSQALLQLKKEYCEKNRCLHCALGVKVLQETQVNSVNL